MSVSEIWLSISKRNSIPFSSALNRSRCTTFRSVLFNENSMYSTLIFPASIFEKSKISLIITNRLSALCVIAFKYLSWSGRGVFSNNSLVIPTMAFIGVRISWLILAMNCCLSFADCSAISFSFTANSISCLICKLCSLLMVFCWKISSFKVSYFLRFSYASVMSPIFSNTLAYISCILMMSCLRECSFAISKALSRFTSASLKFPSSKFILPK